MKIGNKQQIRKLKKANEQPEYSMETITWTYINNLSELTPRQFQPFCMDGAHNPVHKFASYFTKHMGKFQDIDGSHSVWNHVICKKLIIFKFVKENSSSARKVPFFENWFQCPALMVLRNLYKYVTHINIVFQLRKNVPGLLFPVSVIVTKWPVYANVKLASKKMEADAQV
jgi:hypothetical protein